MEFPEYRRAGDVLQISGALDELFSARFDIEIKALLDDAAAQGLERIVVDIRELTSIGSQYVGALATAATEMQRLQGSLAVRAKGQVGELVRQLGLGKVASLEIE
jgi:anti-anti-sigma regulatory factor